MCPIDQLYRHYRRVTVSNCAKNAVPVIRALTARARTVIDRRVGIDHKGIDHRDRAEIDRLYAQNNVIASAPSEPSGPHRRVRRISPARATVRTTSRCHRRRLQPVATPSRCAAADAGRWATDALQNPRVDLLVPRGFFVWGVAILVIQTNPPYFLGALAAAASTIWAKEVCQAARLA